MSLNILLILAAVMGYLSIKYLSAILPADSCEDKGVYTFSPYQVLPVQVQNTGASRRDRRMNPTNTAYMVYYRDTSGSGYQWSKQALTRELGQKIVDAGSYVLLYMIVWCVIWVSKRKFWRMG